MGGYILAILSQIILKQGNIWDTQKVKQKGYLNKNLKQKEKEMKYNDEIVGEQYEIRELVIINFIEWYASEEEDREPLRQAMQLYLQQEIWVELEGMKLEEKENNNAVE